MNAPKLTSITLLGLAIALASACGPKREQIRVVTTPPGATVKVEGRVVGQTPLSTTVLFRGRDERLEIVIEKPGYKAVQKLHHQDDPEELEYQLEPDSVTIEVD